MSQTPIAFLSYVNDDDKYANGKITLFRKHLSLTVKAHRGEPFEIFQDRESIKWGEQWQKRLDTSLDATTFLLPIITPSFFKSDACRAELERFLKREEKLGRDDLILPVYYLNCPILNDKEKLKHDPLAQIIAARQREDWRELCEYSFTTRKVRKVLAKMAEQIVAALERSHSVTNIPQNETKPAPIAKTEQPTVIVDQKGQGDYSTITEALKAVKAGTRILVNPGWYKEGIVINKQVEIIGDGKRDDIVIEASGKDAVVFKADSGRLANLTLRQTGDGGWFAVDITQGRLELEDCDISSQSLPSVAIHGSANPILRRNRIHDGAAAGVWVCDKGQGTLEDNEIFANALAGVEIDIGGKPTLRRNRISKNGWKGIRVYDGGGGIFEDNDLRGNAKGAWDIEPDCTALVQRKGNIE